jgi:dTDP-4-amino-4,6-dideoxygalactose transaminase
VLQDAFARWQNKLPLYNLRMGNLSAALIRPQLDELPRRVRDGLANHDHVAEQLNASPHIDVPAPLKGETRAPDSIQFNLVGLDDTTVDAFVRAADTAGVKVQVFGRSSDNARAFWNWQFVEDLPELPRTRAMLSRACDVRLPVQLKRTDLDAIVQVLRAAIDAATQRAKAVA